ncbi:hypothetical protein D0Z07_2926 [Hyphodiscus hymeniophilus]|uniref:Uncharacterized protein n=1 Tax=Hyphodiscus hymeniophilus TaxID=353542 RepID=A0A9P6VME2_9HELO|nr:hypothetical protein D0Z07_2926 [Hyphodiscus hymeniophilus]
MAAAMAPAAERISFAEPARPRRLSTAATNSTSSVDEENTYEDWSKTTHEKDSWAHRERRRSNKFSTMDSDMAIQAHERSRSGRRASTALGIFSQGVDSNGNAIILSDDHHEEFELPLETDKDGKKLLTPSMAIAFSRPDERRLSMGSQNSEKRRGSILSLWKTGKDSQGNDHVHAGHEGEDWGDAVSTTSGTPPASPRLTTDDRGDRRGSILSIWRQGKDREGRTVMHSGEELDEVIVPLDSHGQPIVVEKKEAAPEQVGQEKVGSILSIWSQGKDKDGKTVIHSGEEHEGPIETPVEKIESPKMKGQERRGSVLSMWTEDTRDAQDRPAPVVLKVHDEEEELKL